MVVLSEKHDHHSLKMTTKSLRLITGVRIDVLRLRQQIRPPISDCYTTEWNIDWSMKPRRQTRRSAAPDREALYAGIIQLEIDAILTEADGTQSRPGKIDPEKMN